MTPHERLHQFLADTMKTLGHSPAVFFGQDQRRKIEQRAPVCVYTYEGEDAISTDDDDITTNEVFTVQVSSRTKTAESDRAEIVMQLINRSRKSSEIDIMTTTGSRDDDLEMSFQVMEIHVSPRHSNEPLVRLGEELTYGTPPKGITFAGARLRY